jgi:hypothetical protein
MSSTIENEARDGVLKYKQDWDKANAEGNKAAMDAAHEAAKVHYETLDKVNPGVSDTLRNNDYAGSVAALGLNTATTSSSTGSGGTRKSGGGGGGGGTSGNTASSNDIKPEDFTKPLANPLGDIQPNTSQTTEKKTVPLAATAKEKGLDLFWDRTTGQAIVYKNGSLVGTYQNGIKDVKIKETQLNGETIWTMHVPEEMLNNDLNKVAQKTSTGSSGGTSVKLREVAESEGYKVEWDGVHGSAALVDKNGTIIGLYTEGHGGVQIKEGSDPKTGATTWTMLVPESRYKEDKARGTPAETKPPETKPEDITPEISAEELDETYNQVYSEVFGDYGHNPDGTITKSKEVIEIQKNLSGYFVGADGEKLEIDGYFGANTVYAYLTYVAEAWQNKLKPSYGPLKGQDVRYDIGEKLLTLYDLAKYTVIGLPDVQKPPETKPEAETPAASQNADFLPKSLDDYVSYATDNSEFAIFVGRGLNTSFVVNGHPLEIDLDLISQMYRGKSYRTELQNAMQRQAINAEDSVPATSYDPYTVLSLLELIKLKNVTSDEIFEDYLNDSVFAEGAVAAFRNMGGAEKSTFLYLVGKQWWHSALDYTNRLAKGEKVKGETIELDAEGFEKVYNSMSSTSPYRDVLVELYYAGEDFDGDAVKAVLEYDETWRKATGRDDASLKDAFIGLIQDVVIGSLGAVPYVGWVFDLANAALYANRGDFTQATISVVAAFIDVKGLAKASKSAEALENSLKNFANSVDDAAVLVSKNLDELSGLSDNIDEVVGVLKNSDEIVGVAKNADEVVDAGKGWYKADGSINYPPNNGAVPGTIETITLQPGGKLGRYGEVKVNSNYITDAGVASNKLALPPNTDPAHYYEYEIVKPIPDTVKSTITEWPIGSGTGGATQYELPMPIETLRLQGYIKLIIK